jgi:hypothetical protein
VDRRQLTERVQKCRSEDRIRQQTKEEEEPEYEGIPDGQRYKMQTTVRDS